MLKHLKLVRILSSDHGLVCGQGSIFKLQAVFNSVWAFTFTFHWALSQLLFSRTHRVSQENVAVLRPMFP